MTTTNKLIIALFLIIFGVVCRLLPHFWNFTPLAAIALFSGVYLGKRYALTIPLVAMLIGDLFIGFYEIKLMLAVYSSLIIIGIIGYFIRKYKSPETIAATSIVASILFFIITNWAVWQFSPWYAKSFEGLIYCYTLALPFFRNALMGDLFYTGVLFGVYEGVRYYQKRKIVLKNQQPI